MDRPATHLFLPIFHYRGRRYRSRARLGPGWRCWRVADHFAEGTVYRYRFGPLLLVVMVD